MPITQRYNDYHIGRALVSIVPVQTPVRITVLAGVVRRPAAQGFFARHRV